MSVLRSFTYAKFPFIDRYGLPAENGKNTLHVASAGMGAPVLHIEIGEIWGDNPEKVFEAEINLSLEEAKILLKHIQAFVECNEGKWHDEEYHGLRFK